MSRVLVPILVIAVIVACALADALELFGPSPAAIVTVAAATPSPMEAPAVAPTLPAPTLPATMTVSPARGSSAGTTAVRRPPPDRMPAPRARPGPAPVSISLADPSDFVPQYRAHWCVGASIQMAEAIITGERDGSRRSQRRLWRGARARSPNSPYNGANPIGWTAMLNRVDVGPYRLVSLPDFETAVQAAARALAETGKPVGLVVWAGHHAWVMTGFDATADPRHGDARVTGVRVMDPLYPHKSKWGRAPAPDRLIGLDALARQFVRRHGPDYDLGVPSGWLVILPEG